MVERELLGERVRLLRERQALTQVELAERAGVSAAAILRIERGTHQARPSTIRKLARALGVKPVELTT
jgi:transcriptional regulator with XRE-family HTH domain